MNPLDVIPRKIDIQETGEEYALFLFEHKAYECPVTIADVFSFLAGGETVLEYRDHYEGINGPEEMMTRLTLQQYSECPDAPETKDLQEYLATATDKWKLCPGY